MSLFPDEDVLTKEIESWKGFAESLRSEEDTNIFLTMLNDCQKYALAINATFSNRTFDYSSSINTA
jgi:hypothetical protein